MDDAKICGLREDQVRSDSEVSFTIRWEGNNGDRYAFISKADEVAFSMGRHVKPNGAGMLLREIVKNIYDHAGGYGQMDAKIDDEGFTFEIFDDGTESFDFASRVNNSSKAGNGVNYGIGLESIVSFAKILGIRLEIDTSKGFRYKGTFKKEKQ